MSERKKHWLDDDYLTYPLTRKEPDWWQSGDKIRLFWKYHPDEYNEEIESFLGQLAVDRWNLVSVSHANGIVHLSYFRYINEDI